MARNKVNKRRSLTAKQKAQRSKQAAQRARITRIAKSLGLTREQYIEMQGSQELRELIYQNLEQKRNKKRMKKGQSPFFSYSEEDMQHFDTTTSTPPPEAEFDEYDEDEDEDAFEPDWSSMSKSDLVVAMLNMMPDETGKRALRLVLSEIPSDDYPELASQLWKKDEAERTGFIVNMHTDIVNQRRRAEQEFMKSEEFAEEVDGAVDPNSWM